MHWPLMNLPQATSLKLAVVLSSSTQRKCIWPGTALDHFRIPGQHSPIEPLRLPHIPQQAKAQDRAQVWSLQKPWTLSKGPRAVLYLTSYYSFHIFVSGNWKRLISQEEHVFPTDGTFRAAAMMVLRFCMLSLAPKNSTTPQLTLTSEVQGKGRAQIY